MERHGGASYTPIISFFLKTWGPSPQFSLLLKVEGEAKRFAHFNNIGKKPGATNLGASSFLEAKGMVKAHPPPPLMKKRTSGSKPQGFLTS
jgi:hypothetical protein